MENYNYAVGKEWVQDKVAWALYHTWKEADDRKTENCSEIPNNCEDEISAECKRCKHFKFRPNCGWECEYDTFEECNYEPKDEPQTERSE